MGLRRHTTNFGYMLVAILCFLILGPLAEELLGSADGVVLMSAYTMMLIMGIWSLHETKMLFYVGLALAGICIGLTIIEILTPTVDLYVYLLGALLAFQCMSIFLAAKFVFGSGPITLNHLMGGICIYLLLGLTWNILYVFGFYMDPGNFSGLSEETIAQDNVYWDMTYFSFVTLTTLGYGDIEPVGRVAKVLAYTQAIVGELFIAILIGALVGQHISHRKHNEG
jgi:voltage-gated potassium channel